jgi:Uma2 family endonuclease
MAVALKGLTLKQFLKLPEQEPALEYFKGVVTQKMPPMIEHSALQGDLVEFLNRLFRIHRVARAFPELRSTFDGVSLVPDVSLLRWDRIPRTPEGEVTSPVTVAPDVAVEIWSVGQSMGEQIERCEWYVQHGVQVALLVHHRQKSIRVFRSTEPMAVHQPGDRIPLDEIAPGAALNVTDIFAALQVD